MNRMFSFCCGVLAAAVLMCTSGTSHPRNATAGCPQAKSAVSAAIENAVRATVRITARDRKEEAATTGSGVIISSAGLVLTARHVVFQDGLPAREIQAGIVKVSDPGLPAGRPRRLQLVAEDESLDLALLQLESGAARNLPFLSLAERADLNFGTALKLVGFPQAGGVTTTVTGATVIGFDSRHGWIKVEGAMMRGVSGGAAIDEQGRLVGIPMRVATDQAPLSDEDDREGAIVTLGKVGFIRSAETITKFLLRHRALTQAALPMLSRGITLTGQVIDSRTGQRLSEVSIGLLPASAGAPDRYISPFEWIALGRTAQGGDFRLNQAVKPGRYWLKAVHDEYEPFIRQIEIVDHQQFEIRLKRE